MPLPPAPSPVPAPGRPGHAPQHQEVSQTQHPQPDHHGLRHSREHRLHLHLSGGHQGHLPGGGWSQDRCGNHHSTDLDCVWHHTSFSYQEEIG